MSPVAAKAAAVAANKFSQANTNVQLATVGVIGLLIGIPVIWAISKVNKAQKAAYNALQKALAKIGLAEGEEDRFIAKEGVEIRKTAFNPNYWRSSGSKVWVYEKANEYAKIIEDAWGGALPDDEDQVYGAIMAQPSHAHLSRVSERYFALFKKDMYADMQSRLSDTEFAAVLALVKDIPLKTK